MTLKQLFSGFATGTDTTLTTATAENVVLFTATSKTIIKEIISTAWGGQANAFVMLYILPTGGTDYSTTDTTTMSGGVIWATGKGTTIILKAAEASNASGVIITARNTILESGDKIKLRILNSVGSDIDATKFGYTCIISGDAA